MSDNINNENEILRKKAILNKANILFDSNSVKKVQEAKRLYDSLGDYEYSANQSVKCIEKIESIEKKKRKLKWISIVIVVAFIAIVVYCNNFNNYSNTNNTTDVKSYNYEQSDNESTSSTTKTTGHTCIVDGCYKTATHYLAGTSGDEWYCDEHYEWMEDFANEIMDYSNGSSNYSSGSHKCAICSKSADYEDPYDKGTWYCYEHYCDAIEWYLDN